MGITQIEQRCRKESVSRSGSAWVASIGGNRDSHSFPPHRGGPPLFAARYEWVERETWTRARIRVRIDREWEGKKKRDKSCEKMNAIIDDPVAANRIVFPVDPLPRNLPCTITRYQSDDNAKLEYRKCNCAILFLKLEKKFSIELESLKKFEENYSTLIRKLIMMKKIFAIDKIKKKNCTKGIRFS